MAERKIEMRLTAKDDASKQIEKVGQALDSVGDEAVDTGRELTDRLGRAADQLERELQDTTRAAEKLRQALGPDLASRADPADLVVQFRKLGLTIEDVEGNVEGLAREVKRLDDVELGFRKLSPAIKGVGDQIDRSRSVMANFAGNAVQDIPGIAGSFGALNVAAGQFAEYAAEGGIAMSGLIKTIAPMAGATLLIGGINHQLDRMAKIKAFNEEQVRGWIDAIREGKTELEHIRDMVNEKGELVVSRFFGGVDLIPQLNQIGVTAEQFAKIITFNDEQLASWRKQMQASGVDGDALSIVMTNLHIAVDNYRKSLEGAAITQQFLGEGQDAVVAKGNATRDAIDATKQSLDAAAAAAQGLTSALNGIPRHLGVDVALNVAGGGIFDAKIKEALVRETKVSGPLPRGVVRE